MMFEERIKIVVGNDLPLAVRMRTSNGRFHYDINPSDVSNVRVFVGPQRQDRAVDITNDTYERQGEVVPCVKVENNIIRILIKKERLPKIGLNSLWITATYRGMAATLAYGERIEVVPYSEMSSVEGALVSDMPEVDPHWPHHHRHPHLHGHMQHPHLPVDCLDVRDHRPGEPMMPIPPNSIFELEGLFIPVEYTDQDIDDLKADLRVAIAEFQQSKSEADALKLALTDIVTNAKVDSAKQEILEAIIARGGGGLTPEQWAQIAKEKTLIGLASTLAAYQTANAAKLDTITSMLTLADGEVTAELETLIPNE